MASWLKATIRAALLAIAVGGGLFVLSQVLAPSEAHAETLSASTDPVSHVASDSSLLGPTLSGLGSTLGSVTHAVDGTVSGVGAAANAVTKPATGAVSAVVSTTVNVLPAPVRAPVKAVTSPVTQTVSQVASPLTQTVSQLGAAKPASTLIGGVSTAVDGVVSGVEQTPVVGSALSGIAGRNPISTLTSPAASGLDDAIASLAGTVDATVTETTDGLDAGLSGEAPAIGSLPIADGLLPGDTALDSNGGDVLPGDSATLPGGTATAAAPRLAAAEQPGGLLGAFSAPSTGRIAALTAAPSPVSSAQLATPLGSPLAPGGLLAGSAGSAAVGGGSGAGSTPFASPLSGFDFPALDARLSTLEDTDALPASPVFEHDSTPD